MTKTNENKTRVNGILSRARKYNHEIGNYEEHFVDDNIRYTLKLTNGRIIIPIEMAQDQEAQPASISDERIKKVADTFKKGNLI